MRKKLLASVFVLSILASTVPIFAVNTTNTTALNPTQLAKLNETQTKLTSLVANIDNLLTTYKNKTKKKGLLIALQQYKKQAKILNAQIARFIKHPTKNADKRINSFVKRESQLEHKVNTISKILNKTQNKTQNKTKQKKTLNKTKQKKTLKNGDKPPKINIHQTNNSSVNITH